MDGKSRQRFKNGRFKKKMNVTDCNNNDAIFNEVGNSNGSQLFENDPTSAYKDVNIDATDFSDILEDYARVYFDLEATGLGIADITYVAVVCGQSPFRMYVKPKIHITASASKVTGLTYDGISMFYQGTPVVCYYLHHMLKSFKEWLTSFIDLVLFAHNCRKFDSLVLCNAMNKVLDVKLHEYFLGFCDTLDFFRAILPDHEKFSLEYLVSNILKISYNTHDALEDSQIVTKTHRVTSACG